MGSYRHTKKEIYDKLEETLNNFEGDITERDFRDMSNELADNYKNFLN